MDLLKELEKVEALYEGEVYVQFDAPVPEPQRSEIIKYLKSIGLKREMPIDRAHGEKYPVFTGTGNSREIRKALKAKYGDDITDSIIVLAQSSIGR